MPCFNAILTEHEAIIEFYRWFVDKILCRVSENRVEKPNSFKTSVLLPSIPLTSGWKIAASSASASGINEPIAVPVIATMTATGSIGNMGASTGETEPTESSR